MIPGFERRELVEAQIAALKREKGNIWSLAHLEAIDGQIAIFEAELEGLGDGDYPEPERAVRPGAFAYIDPSGHEHVR